MGPALFRCGAGLQVQMLGRGQVHVGAESQSSPPPPHCSASLRVSRRVGVTRVSVERRGLDVVFLLARCLSAARCRRLAQGRDALSPAWAGHTTPCHNRAGVSCNRVHSGKKAKRDQSLRKGLREYPSPARTVSSRPDP